MRLTKLSLLATAVLAAACGSSSNNTASDPLAAAVPDSPGTSLEATGASSEDANPSSNISMPLDGGIASGLEFLPVIRQGIHDLNQGMQQFFTPIGQLIATQGTDIVVGTSKIYGPLDQGGVTYQLTVKRFATNRYAWLLQGKTSGSASTVAFTSLAAGTLFHAATDEAHRGRGQIGVDLDAFASVSPGSLGEGKIYVAYSNYDVADTSGLAGDEKTLVYVLDKFTVDSSAHPAVSAAFVGHKTRTGVRAARVAYYGEIPALGGNTSLNELLLGRARFNPGVGGRADALLAGGNVPAGTAVYGAECWDVSESLTWQKVWNCDISTLACTVEGETGSAAACAVDLQTDDREAPSDSTSTTLEVGAPDPSVTATSTMPDFNNPS
jgi:hypothetical protein